MLKIKSLRTADCVVGGFRYATGKRLVGSLLLGLYDKEGLLDHVGFTSAISDDERAARRASWRSCVAAPASPATRRADRVAGPPSAVHNGSR